MYVCMYVCIYVCMLMHICNQILFLLSPNPCLNFLFTNYTIGAMRFIPFCIRLQETSRNSPSSHRNIAPLGFDAICMGIPTYLRMYVHMPLPPPPQYTHTHSLSHKLTYIHKYIHTYIQNNKLPCSCSNEKKINYLESFYL